MDDDLFVGISKHRKSVKSTLSLVPLNVFPYMTGGTGKPLPAAVLLMSKKSNVHTPLGAWLSF